jgi:hypothetical protein
MKTFWLKLRMPMVLLAVLGARSTPAFAQEEMKDDDIPGYEDQDYALADMPQCPSALETFNGKCTFALVFNEDGKHRMCHCDGKRPDAPLPTALKLKLLSSIAVSRIGDSTCDYVVVDGKRKRVCWQP